MELNLKLSGVSITHDVFRLGYCFKESLQSLLDLCDEVVVADAESTDGTLEYLHEVECANPKLKVIQTPWELGEKHERLAIISNMAREEISSPWYFYLQGDEVLHENEMDSIRKAVASGNADKYVVGRINFWKDANHYVYPESGCLPCSHQICRFAKKEYPLVGDAEGI